MATTTARQRLVTSGAAMALVMAIAMPAFASAANSSADTTVNAIIGSAISLTTSTTVAINITPTSGGAVSSESDTVTVNTNNLSGYALTLADSDADTNMVSGSNTMAAHDGSFASPTTLGNNTWGYRIVGAGGFGGSAYSAETSNSSSTSTWAGVPASSSPTSIKTTSSAASNDITTVWYGVKATAGQANGVYTNQVTYSATTNP